MKLQALREALSVEKTTPPAINGPVANMVDRLLSIVSVSVDKNTFHPVTFQEIFMHEASAFWAAKLLMEDMGFQFRIENRTSESGAVFVVEVSQNPW